jgi:hypothetical protein
MNDAELLEALAAWSANGINSFTVYISITFAYLTASYFVGKALSRSQTIILSGLYIVSALSAALSNLAAMDALRILMETYPNLLDSSPYFKLDLWIVFMNTICTLGIILSLYFMYQVRNDGDT